MDAGAVIYARLEGQTTAGQNVFPLLLPEGPTLPAVTYQQISSVQLHQMGASAPLYRVRVQVDVWGQTYAQARTLANEVAGQLNRYRGAVGTTQVIDVLAENELETYEMDADLRRVTQDYTLFLTTIQ